MMRSHPVELARCSPAAPASGFAHAAYRALLVEVNLTPKPGLVDRHNNGAHRDMNIGHFYRSARAIGIWLPRFVRQGQEDARCPAAEQLVRLRPLGLACENHMFQATGGVNTHKGSVFSLGLLCTAFGRLSQKLQPVDAATLCAEVASMCRGLVARELQQRNALQTAGQRLFAQHGLSGARGEAESGFERVINGALPLYLQRLNAGCDEQTALMDSLLWLMANNDDTNVASRGGLEGLRWLQRRANELLAQGGALGEQGIARLRQFDAECIHRNLSPGGSADLLIVTWLLAQLPNSTKPAAFQAATWNPQGIAKKITRLQENLMSETKEKIWKALAPLLVLAILLWIPTPDGMPPQAWRYFAIFVAMIVGMILEPIPATAISFIAVTLSVLSANWVLFGAQELAEPGFKAGKEALKWGLAGFSSTTVWLVFGAFIFALGYEATGLGRRIALFLVKFMGKRTLTLGYAVVIIDILLAPFTPSNTARTGGTVFPVVKNLPPLFDSFPNDPSSRRIGGYLMWMMVVGTSISSSMFVTGAAPNVLGIEFVSKIAGVHISWMQWFLAFLPVGLLLLVIAPLISYYLYKPGVTHSSEVASWANSALGEMGKLTRKEYTLIGLVLLSLCLWVFGGKILDATTVCLLAVSLMLALHVVSWKDITKYSSAWNTLVNLATLVVMANGLTRSGFIDWFALTMSTHLDGFSPDMTVVALVLVFYFAHYLFASLSAHTATLLPVILAVGKGLPGVPMEQLSMLLVLSIGIMGVLTPYATGPGVIIYGCGYVKSKDYWRMGGILGVVYIAALLLIGWPIMRLWM